MEGKQESICTLLEERFGPSSKFLQNKVRSIDDQVVLDKVLKNVFAAESLEKAQKVVQELAQK